MDKNQSDPFLDELLDASLENYKVQEPRPGLEIRLLANLHAAQQRTHPMRWAWTLAAASVAALALIVFVSRRQPAPVTAPAPAAAGNREPRVVAPRPASVPPKPVRPVRRATTKETRPPQFPTPAPLSEEERLLLAFVAQTPASVMDKRPTGNSMIEPLKIDEIEIAMIEIKKLPKLMKEEP